MRMIWFSTIEEMEHYLELVEEGTSQATKGEEILELLNAGELADAEHEMSELAGIEAEQHDEADEPHSEGDAH